MQIVSIVVMFIVSIIFLAGAFMLAAGTDDIIHQRKNYSSYNLIKLNVLKHLFCKHKSDFNNEIYVIAFIEQLICYILLIITIVSMFLSFFLKDDIFVLGCLIVSLVYFCVPLIIHYIFKRKFKGNK